MSKSSPHFDAELFAFLGQLAANNDKAWFASQKHAYEAAVRAPLLAFIGDFSAKLAQISDHFVADPRKQGGSMFRIHRDVRFSKDKSPYKTHAAAQFRHEAGKDVHAPGYYLQLEPGHVLCGAGIWHPDGPTLRLIREAIVANPKGWQQLRSKLHKAGFRLGGESLSRPPQGFDKAHPLIEDIRRKDFLVLKEFDESEALQPGFLAAFATLCRQASPLVAFLCQALGLPF